MSRPCAAEKNDSIGNWPSSHSYDILVKNLALYSLRLKNLSEIGFNSDRLIGLTGIFKTDVRVVLGM